VSWLCHCHREALAWCGAVGEGLFFLPSEAWKLVLGEW
jgi:hypothetical protein